ncbi:IS30 family transposase, partial [Clostridium thermobutyricum]|uniref:IS30 family transposase n=1 Tax=Clostridium thermobutyricum TaxID=29372 RepID=UPI0018AA2745
MNYKHLTTFERSKIEVLNKLSYSTREIAKEINRHHSTIARELNRNNKVYNAELAEANYHERRKASRYIGKFKLDLISDIELALENTWSPEQISNTLTKGKLSFKTIYRWIYLGYISNDNLSKLRQKGKRSSKVETRGKFLVGKSIYKRSKLANTREEFGHWELDTVVSSRGKSKGCLATFIERKTRLYTAIKIKDRTANSMKSAIKQIFNVLPKGAFKTATVDRGKEFACYKDIEKDLNIDVYFADPYSSWQRGSNENSNGLLREFYPKKTDLALIDNKELVKNLFLINNRPRKCLNWKSSIEVFLHEV